MYEARAALRKTRSAVWIVWYKLRGRKPWSPGYWEYRNAFIASVLRNKQQMARFRTNQSLVPGYGVRLDERVVEYPWVLSRLDMNANLLLDAGSTLNWRDLLDLPMLACRSVVIYTLAPGAVYSRPNISYIYGDLRSTILRDGCCDEIVCISTLEHVGMDNTLIYTEDERYREAKLDDYLLVVKEFRRLLRPGGRLLVTVPFGRFQDLGWLQQFNKTMIDSVVDTFGGHIRDQAFFRYSSNGWKIANAAACGECEYYDVHSQRVYAPDFAAAARAVACLELEKPG